MSDPRGERIERLFIAAQQVAPAERAAYLEHECAGDAELRREIEELLASVGGSEAYFRRLADRIGVAGLFGVASPERDAGEQDDGEAGRQVGSYTLTGRIGAGGMGSVWSAERSDGRFEGRVAIQLLNLERGSAATRRFEQEGGYLAKLTHPNIARLLDAGLGADGRPFLVIELVDGVRIDQYCDDRLLDVPARIRLFLDVLAAVAHAHAHLIVHRDIKPSNVLVTRDGVAKLLDFGVAKLLRGDADTAAGVTREIGMALTPEYAAPEQLLDRPITTATDVYSLGLLLCTLLAGRHARSGDGDEARHAWQTLTESESPRLSEMITELQTRFPDRAAAIALQRRATPAGLRRLFRGDLDNIVRKALAFEPAARYGTVADFAEDLRRHLRHQPVSAQPPTVRYRLGKFVRRHRGGVAATLLVAFALVASTAIAAWQMIEARRQRDLALYQQQRAQATNEFLSLLLGELGPEGKPLTLVELLDRGVALLDRQFDADERFVARTLYDISILYATLGQVDRQQELLDRSSTLARTLEDRDLLATVLCAQARAEIAGTPDAARKDAVEGRRLLAAVRDPSLDGVVECHRADAMIREVDGDADGAVTQLTAALRAVESSPAPSVTAQVLLLNDLAEQHFKGDRSREALKALDQILALTERSGRGGTIGHVTYLLNRAAILSRMGEVARAAEDQRRALARMAGLPQPIVGASGHYANSLLRLGRYDEALSLFMAGRDAAEAADNTRFVALNELLIGATLVRMGKAREAEPHLASAEAVLLEGAGANQRLLTQIALVRSEILLTDGDLQGARRAVDTVLAGLGYPGNRDAPGLSSALWHAARSALASSDFQAAERFASDGLAAATSMAREPRSSADVGQALHLRAQARDSLGQHDEAISDLRAAVESLGNGFGPDHPETREARERLQRLGT